MKRTLIAAALAAAFAATVHAAPRWNEQSLNAAAVQAEAEINDYLQHNTGPVSRLMSESVSDRLAIFTFAGNGEKTFANLQNRDELLRTLIKRSTDHDDYTRRIAFSALLADYDKIGSQTAWLNDQLALYEYIMRHDSESIPFAFAALRDLSPQFAGRQQESYAYLLERYGFHFKEIEVDRYREQPEICLHFNYDVLAEPRQDWRSKITIEPAPLTEGRHVGKRLCYSARWDTEYTVRIDPTLAAEYRRLPLGDEISETVNTGDRPPMARFAARGKTLALTPDAALTVESSNVNTIWLELWQIPGNNLAGEARDAIDNPEGFSSYRIEENASFIWKGSFTPEKGADNSIVKSRIAFRDMAGDDARAGVYVLITRPRDEERYYNRSILGFTVTDQGFTVYQTDDGILAELRDLQSGMPVVGQNVILYAQNNRILGEAKTDPQGIARFSRAQTHGEGSDAPGYITSEKDHHLAYLRIAGQGIDLADKGLSGTVHPNPTLEHWTWHDRGVYRPKDTMNALWLFKTPDGKAFHDSPLWLEIRRPDGALMHSQLLEADASGAYRYSADIPANARQGDWNIRISLGKNGATVVDETYRVDSVIPRQIENSLAITATADRAALDLSTAWLYGAPAGGLLSDGRWRIISGDYGKAHPAWTGWQIGRFDDNAVGAEQQIPQATTGADGKRHIPLDNLERPFDTRPQALRVYTEVTAPDGSIIPAVETALLPRHAPYIALKENENGAHIAVINDQGEQQAAPLSWKLYSIERDWYWYYKDDNWRWEKTDNRRLEAEGDLRTDGQNPTDLELPLQYGDYILEVRGTDDATAASLPIERGWYKSGDPGSNNPSAITLLPDRRDYKAGDILTLNLQIPFKNGKTSIKVANRDRIIASYDTAVKDGKAQLQIPWQNNWEGGIWLLANAWNDDLNDHNRRAVGLHWVGADLSARRLLPSLTLPENPQQNAPYTVAVHVPAADDNTWVNLAIVDDGLYQLAAPSFSDPLAAFFGKKQLGLTLYDTFGSIIRQTDAQLAALRSGADSATPDSERAALASLPDLDLTLISHWSGPLKVDTEGNVRYTIPIPHYNGRLRIMTAAYNADQSGTAEETAIIKAPVVAEINSPRYLAAEDSGTFNIRLHNTTDHSQRLKLDLRTEGLTLAEAPALPDSLAPNQQITLNYPYRADKAGDAYIKATISGDYNEILERRIPVRASALPQVRTQYERLDSGATLELTNLNDASLTLNSGLPDNLHYYQEQLADYPLGCSEQTTGKLWGLLGAKIPNKKQLLSAENRLANLAHSNGGYGLWTDSPAERWLTAYVGEALTEMHKRKQLKNPAQLTRLLGYLRSKLDGKYRSEHEYDDSYAYYTLAYAGENIRGSLLQYHYEAGKALDLASSLDIATALTLLGEYQAASERLSLAAADDKISNYNYASGTSLPAHNLARLKQLESQWANLHNDPTQTRTVIARLHEQEREKLNRVLAHDGYLSTQELAWLTRLATVADQLAADTPITVNDKTITLAELKKETYNGSVRISNPGERLLWLDAHDLHVPDAADASENGWNVTLRYEDRDGRILDSQALPNNTDIRIVATFKKTYTSAFYQEALVYNYPVPAGITLTALRDETDDADDKDKGGKAGKKQDDADDDKNVRYQYRENRDDRHIAAFTIDYNRRDEYRDRGSFKYTINARTTRAGTWHAPGASIENMYHPEEHARQAAQTIHIR